VLQDSIELSDPHTLAQTTRPAWSLKTFFQYVGQAIFQPDSQPISGSTQEQVKTLSCKLLTTPYSNTHHGNPQWRQADQLKTPSVDLMTLWPLTKHDYIQAASSEGVEKSNQALAGANPEDVHTSLPVQYPEFANQLL
jgi:hypothetical protein